MSDRGRQTAGRETEEQQAAAADDNAGSGVDGHQHQATEDCAENSSTDQDSLEEARLAALEDGEARGRGPSASVTSFVDYVPPSAAKLLPPAKYKLALVITVLVYLSSWWGQKSQFVTFLEFGGWASRDFALFLFLGTSSFTLTYGGVEVFRTALTFRAGGQERGLGAWLKRPRAMWFYRHPDSAVCEALAGVVHILENGFAMFDAPEEPEAARAPPVFGDGLEGTTVQLRVDHVIDRRRIGEYENWRRKIEQLSHRKAHGLVAISKTVSQRGGSVDGGDREGEGVHYSILLTFKDIDRLNEWMASPRRKVLIDELRSYLAVPTAQRLRLDRKLPGAFVDLVVPQGASVPALPPKKWKVWWLTTISLFLSQKWSTHFMAHYYQFWGLNDVHVRLKALVSTPVSVFTSSYIVTPLLLFLFAPWLKRTKHETVDCKEPWHTLNEGLPTFWGKMLLTSIFYGGMLIAWVVKDPTFP